MVLIKATPASEAGVLPDQATIEAMGRFKQELVDAGVLLGGEGLRPTRDARRLRLTGGKRVVVDGPFTETKELIGGYWLWQVASLDDAVAWAQRCADHMPPGDWELELRPLFEADDFGDAYPPALRAQDERFRAAIAGSEKRGPRDRG